MGYEIRRGLCGWVSPEPRLERAVRGLCGPVREHLSFAKTGVCETASREGTTETSLAVVVLSITAARQEREERGLCSQKALGRKPVCAPRRQRGHGHTRLL